MLHSYHVKNMVCDRCIRTVEKAFRAHGVNPNEVRLGVVETSAKVSASALKQIEDELEKEGFELLKDKEAATVEQIKTLIVEMIASKEISMLNKNISTILELRIGRDYHYLSTLFSQTQAVTIARYVILQKIEKAKELLSYGEDSLAAIAKALGYSSVHHFSNQFKEVTGMAPSNFRSGSFMQRKQLDKV